MTNTNFRNVNATFRDFARDAARGCRRAARAIAVMPWPAMLGCCIALAVVITLLASVLPLALFLFAAFMAVKMIIVGFAVHARSKRSNRDYTL